jgi:hypothetical protein
MLGKSKDFSFLSSAKNGGRKEEGGAKIVVISCSNSNSIYSLLN